MEKSLFRFIWKFSARQQLFILFLTVLSYPVSYILLELPKQIVNDAVQGDGFPREIQGFEFDQISYLFLLCITFLGLVIVSNGLKLWINVYKGRLGERMLRRLRFELFQRVLRFRLPHFRKVSSGEIIPMITAEVEDVGGFVGDAIALPAYQGGLLVVQVGFIFMQDPLLGLAAVSSYPLQAYIIPKLQKKVVLLSRQRVKNVRVISDKLGEAITGVHEIHANDTSALHSADIADRLYENFKIRYEIYNRKYFIKFVNNFMNQLTPFFFYLIGGYLVIEGNLSIGALLAVIAAYKDLAGPWKELLAYYQLVADVEVKYQTVVENFDAADLYPVERLVSDERTTLSGPLEMHNVSFSGGAAGQEVFGVSLEVPEGAHCAIAGGDGSGRSEVLQLAAGLVSPGSGRVEIGGHDLERLAEATLGREIAYVGGAVHIWTGTIRDNLYYGLKHRPQNEVQRTGADLDGFLRAMREARETRNPLHDVHATWEDLRSAGVSSQEDLDVLALALLSAAGMEGDIYRLGLQSRFDPAKDPEFVERILAVRGRIAERIHEDGRIAALVDLWDANTFNQNASLAENLFFAVPSDPNVMMDHMPSMPEVKQFLSETGLEAKLELLGLRIAETMVELFANVSGDSGLLSTYSFITQDDLPEFDRIVRAFRSEALRNTITPADRARLVTLAFRLIPARHRLGVLDEDIRAKVLEARLDFRRKVVDGSRNYIAVDPAAYLPPLSIEDNLLFGRARLDRRDARQRIDALVRQVVEEEGLREPIIFTGFDYHVGVSGSRLSAGQRRKLALVRGLLKNAPVTILDDVAAGPGEDDRQLRGILREILAGRTVLFGTAHADVAAEFDQAVIMDQGRTVRQDSREEQA